MIDVERLKAALPPIAEIVPGLKKKTANELAGPCPWCGGEDRFVVFLDNGRFLCRGCTPTGGDVADFLTRQEGTDIKGLAAKYLDRLDEPKAKRERAGNRRHVATWTYQRADGTPFLQVDRFDWDGGAKDYPTKRLDGKPVTGMTDHEPYHLPEVIQATTVFILEGEKCCDMARDHLGIVATTNPQGAGKWQDALTPYFTKKDIIIVPDNDNPGRKHAQDVARKLHGLAGRIRVVELPGLPIKGDICDWIETGHTPAELQALVDQAPEWTPGKAEEQRSEDTTKALQKFNPVDIGALLSMALPERDYIIKPVIPEQGLCMVYGLRGGGKTWFVLQMAYVIATGALLFGQWNAPKPRRVLYIDGEMPARTIQKRLASIVAGSEQEPPEPSYLSILTPDLQDVSMPNLATLEGQEAIQPLIEQVEIVIVDNLACLARNGRENDSESWLPVQTWLLRLRRLGKSVVIVHHAGKGGNQRGTSAKEDVLDTVIALRRPDDYDPTQGARLEVHLEKARGAYGPEARPFELQLHYERGVASWTHRTIEDVEKARALELHGLGYSIRDIALEMGVSKSKAQRLIKEVGL